MIILFSSHGVVVLWSVVRGLAAFDCGTAPKMSWQGFAAALLSWSAVSVPWAGKLPATGGRLRPDRATSTGSGSQAAAAP